MPALSEALIGLTSQLDLRPAERREFQRKLLAKGIERRATFVAFSK